MKAKRGHSGVDPFHIDPTFGVALNLVYSLVAFPLFVWALGHARRRASSTARPDSRGGGAVLTR